MANKLTGTIPSEIGLASNLSFFWVFDNFLSGTVPIEMWKHLSLFASSVENNPELGGTLPTEIGLSSSLGVLLIEKTQISGTIPSEVGLLTSMFAIEMGDANLTGTIPTELAALSSLEEFLIRGNPLSGTFPYAMANKSASLQVVRMNDTMLTGKVPDWLCSIEELWFDCPDMCGCDCGCPELNASSGALAANTTT